MFLLADIEIKQKILSNVQFLKDNILSNSLIKKLNRGFKEF